MAKARWLALAFLAAVEVGVAEIPPRPEMLSFPPLTFEVPKAERFKVNLSQGIAAYVAEDRLLPLVTVQVYFRGGRYLEERGKEGTAQLLGTVWRTGGAGDLDPQALDETLDFLAAQLSTSVGPTYSSVSLNLLKKDLDRGLQLLFDVMLRPRFDEARLAKAKEDLIAELKRRNDDAAEIEQREWQRLVYGDDYWLNRLPTKASVEAIGRQDLQALHRRIVNPANCVVAVAGDVDRQEMVRKLKGLLDQWKVKGESVPPVPQPTHQAKPGVYLVHKADVNQGRVSLGHLGAKRPLAEEFAITVANDVLGGGGFTAWMMSRIRSDEGLAYSAYSSYNIGEYFPGTFRASFQSKSSTCARAAFLTLDLVGKLRRGEVTEQELVTSKNSFIETFPRNFESKLRTVQLYAQDDLAGRPHAYWLTYREQIRRVDRQAVKQAAEKLIKPEEFVILVVGNVDEILQGHPDFPEIQLAKLGPLTRLPLRDPLTLQPLP
ncbi:MAG: insulinase family protein [Thermoanaerobaculum sp.]|nr:insulinase family protein [Thermoanaerobaculum sp.]MCX7895770.1 insulinase family protein [Thermoanaerobaculum sp.]MDW7967993.1 pitrilysin family protein [Thermoanaerobaculum sp.]